MLSATVPNHVPQLLGSSRSFGYAIIPFSEAKLTGAPIFGASGGATC